MGRTADLIHRGYLAVKIKPERLKQRDPKDLSLSEYVNYYLQKFEGAFIAGGITAAASVCLAIAYRSLGRSA